MIISDRSEKDLLKKLYWDLGKVVLLGLAAGAAYLAFFKG